MKKDVNHHRVAAGDENLKSEAESATSVNGFVIFRGDL
jgi:hypothetical protein